MYFYKVKLKYTLDSRCESISEKTVKGKRKGKSLTLDTLCLEQKKPTIATAIVGFCMIECVIAQVLRLQDLRNGFYFAGVITTSTWLPEASKPFKNAAIFSAVRASTAAL